MREYHAIVSLAEKDVNTSLGMEQPPQRSDKIYVYMHIRISDESYIPTCKGSGYKKLSTASLGGSMRDGPSRTHVSGGKRIWQKAVRILIRYKTSRQAPMGVRIA